MTAKTILMMSLQAGSGVSQDSPRMRSRRAGRRLAAPRVPHAGRWEGIATLSKGGRGVRRVLTEGHVEWLCRVDVCEEIEICGVVGGKLRMRMGMELRWD